MSYYDTIDDDVKRAKEILAKGAKNDDTISYHDRATSEPPVVGIGTIWGADIYAAYKLLESFVAEIEQLRPAYSVAARLVGTLQARVEDLEKESDTAGKGWAECIALNKRLLGRVAELEGQREMWKRRARGQP